MPARKTGTVTGSTLDPKERGKKVKETSTPIADTASETVQNTPVTPTESPAIPTPQNIIEKLQQIGSSTAATIEKGTQAVQSVQGFASRITESIKSTDNDRNPSGITDGKVNTSEILARASADIDENVPQLDSAEATRRNIVIARQRNFVGVAINNTKLKQDLATLDNEQKRLVGMLVDGRTLDVNNETKAVQFHRATTKRDTELSALEQDRELLVHQQIKTEGTQAQTPLVQQLEQLKVAKMREEIEKQGHEIQAISYEKEKIKAETEAKFAAGF